MDIIKFWPRFFHVLPNEKIGVLEEKNNQLMFFFNSSHCRTNFEGNPPAEEGREFTLTLILTVIRRDGLPLSRWEMAG
jgi:hypothetical protein